MRFVVAVFLLWSISCSGQVSLADQQEGKRLEIEQLVASNTKKLIVFVKVKDQAKLQIVLDQKWPKNIETTYNILKDSEGKVVYVGEFPASESGDWTLAFKHYFDGNGKLIAFETIFSYFNTNCTESAIVDHTIDVYNTDFQVLRTMRSERDKDGNPISDKSCRRVIEWDIQIGATVADLIKLMKLPL